jgi:hypothetical protein
MGSRLLGFLVGQKPNNQFVSNRIIRHVGFSQQTPKMRDVLALNEAIHADLELGLRRERAVPSVTGSCHRQGSDTANVSAADTGAVINVAHKVYLYFRLFSEPFRTAAFGDPGRLMCIN